MVVIPLGLQLNQTRSELAGLDRYGSLRVYAGAGCHTSGITTTMSTITNKLQDPITAEVGITERAAEATDRFATGFSWNA